MEDLHPHDLLGLCHLVGMDRQDHAEGQETLSKGGNDLLHRLIQQFVLGAGAISRHDGGNQQCETTLVRWGFGNFWHRSSSLDSFDR